MKIYSMFRISVALTAVSVSTPGVARGGFRPKPENSVRQFS